MNYKIGIVWANPYSKNLGVAALAYSALSLIYEVLEEKGLEGEFTFVGANKKGHDKIDINGQVIEFKTIRGLDYLKPKSIAQLLLKSKKFSTSDLLKFNRVFDIAEGDSFTDIYGAARFKKILNSKRFFSLLGVKQVLLPQTIGPFNDSKHESDAFKVMKSLDFVISRDKKSYDYTKRFLDADKIAETIDVAFHLPFEQRSFGNDSIHVGLNISGLLWNGGYTKDNQFNMKTDYRKLILDLLSYFSSQTGVQIHLISHVVPQDFAVEDDFVVSEEIKKDYPRVIVAPRFSNPIEAKSYISGMDFFSGARMHACIGAFSAGVPVVPMAYSRKFNGLFGDTLNYSWMADCVNVETEQVYNTIIQGFNERKILKEEIEKRKETIIRPRIKILKEILYRNLTN